MFHLQKSLSTIDDLIAITQKGIELSQERRTALISAAVTGKIDVRDWVAPDTQDIEEPQGGYRMSMDSTKELIFQDEMIAQMIDRGWVRGKTDGYDRERALYSQDERPLCKPRSRRSGRSLPKFTLLIPSVISSMRWWRS